MVTLVELTNLAPRPPFVASLHHAVLGLAASLIVLESVIRVLLAWLYVQVPVGVCGPLIVRVQSPPGVPLKRKSHLKPLSRARVPEALVAATELVDLSVIKPWQGLGETVAGMPKIVSLQLLVAGSSVRASLPEREVPSALVLAVMSALGHLSVRPLKAKNQSSDVSETLVLTGVSLAWAGWAAMARAVSAAASSSRLRLKGVGMVCAPMDEEPIYETVTAVEKTKTPPMLPLVASLQATVLGLTATLSVLASIRKLLLLWVYVKLPVGLCGPLTVKVQSPPGTPLIVAVHLKSLSRT